MFSETFLGDLSVQNGFQTLVKVQVSDANFSHVSSAAKVISSAAVDQKQIIAVVETRWGGGLTNRVFIV